MNIFLGDSSENRSIQEHLDKGHPEMAGRKLRDHVARIKRAWALDSSFKPSGGLGMNTDRLSAALAPARGR